jgi:hypothetical protein
MSASAILLLCLCALGYGVLGLFAVTAVMLSSEISQREESDYYGPL